MTAVFHPEMRPPGRRGFGIALPATATDGAAALVEARIAAATAGPPLHVHHASEETYFIISGALVMYIGGEVTELKTGSAAYISRGTEHTWATPLGSEAHFLTLHTPGGYEEYHPAALQLEEDLSRPPTTDDLAGLARHYDWKLAGSEVLRLLPTGELVEASRADAAAEAAAAAGGAAARPR
jgi:mannose-6-phosphate isomerase-like protein (cupin superfamily)